MVVSVEEISKFVQQNKEVISALGGVTIGSLITYFASVRLEHVKAKELTERLHCLLFNEIYSHTNELDRVIDSVLPAWLLRGQPQGGLKYNFRIHPLNTFCFDSFIAQFAYSPLLVPITNYYQSVKELNETIEYLYGVAKDNEIDIKEIIPDCYQLLNASVLAIEDLLNTRDIEKHFTELIKNRIDDFKIYKKRYLYHVALSKYDYQYFLKWESDLRKGNIPRDLPAPFSEDKGVQLLSYLEASRVLTEH